MREGVPSSVLSSDKLDPWRDIGRDGGFEPARLLGREFVREPVGVSTKPVLFVFFLWKKQFFLWLVDFFKS